MALPATAKTFLDEVIAATPHGERLKECIQCGTCGGSCPNGPEMESTPRRIFAMIRVGMRDEVLSLNTMWKCVSCYFCTSRCPQEIPITDIMYTLKRMSVLEDTVSDRDAPALAKTFAGNIERYGRSFELGLASRFYLIHKPATSLLRMGPLGMRLFKKGRMSLRPDRIQNLDELQAIILKARELGGAS